jgi:hypothetical protein
MPWPQVTVVDINVVVFVTPVLAVIALNCVLLIVNTVIEELLLLCSCKGCLDIATVG